MTLPPRGFRITLTDYDLAADIGFHAFEIGAPQRLLVSVDVWIEEAAFARSDDPAAAWDYDFIRTEVGRLARARRYNLQETLVRAIYDLVAARPGVLALTVSARKPDVYPDCESIGVTLSSAPPPGGAG